MKTQSISLIDPPITPFSSNEEIKKWLEELKKMPQDDIGVQACIEEATSYLTKPSDASN